MTNKQIGLEGCIEEDNIKLNQTKVKTEKAKYKQMSFNQECRIYLCPQNKNLLYLMQTPQIVTPDSVDVTIFDNSFGDYIFEQAFNGSTYIRAIPQDKIKKITIESPYNRQQIEQILRKSAPEYASETNSSYPLIAIPEEKLLSIIKNLELKVKE